MNSTIKSGILALLTLATTSYASLSIQSGKNDLLTWICLAFVGLLVGCQLIPGLTRLIRLNDMVQGHEESSPNSTMVSYSDLLTTQKGKK